MRVISALLSGLLVSAAWAEEACPPAVERASTWVADHNLALWIGNLPPTCQVLSMTIERHHPLWPGILRVSRLVRPDAQRGRGVALSLSPEFWPSEYAPGHISWQCLNQLGQASPRYRNRAPFALREPSVSYEALAQSEVIPNAQ